MVTRLLAWLVMLAACGAPLESPSLVVDLRVLAVQLEPPELVLDLDGDAALADGAAQLARPFALRALVVDPGRARRLAWTITLCPPTESKRCDDPDAPIVEVARGVADAGAAIAADVTVDASMVLAALQLDPLQALSGVALQLTLVVWPDGDPAQAVHAAKRLLVAPPRPAGRVANRNPWLAALTRGGAPLPPGRCAEPAAPRASVAAGATVELAPVEPDGVRERYALPTHDGDARSLTENLRYAWYATDGAWRDEQTGGPIDAFGNAPRLANRWTAPAAPGEVSLWLVQRDERGGLAWQEHCLFVE